MLARCTRHRALAGAGAAQVPAGATYSITVSGAALATELRLLLVAEVEEGEEDVFEGQEESWEVESGVSRGRQLAPVGAPTDEDSCCGYQGRHHMDELQVIVQQPRQAGVTTAVFHQLNGSHCDWPFMSDVR